MAYTTRDEFKITIAPETEVEHYKRVIQDKRAQFFLWIRDHLHVSRILYAGSGFDRLPKHVLGENRIIHLSMEETSRPYHKGYLSWIGRGLKVGADFRKIPFDNATIDAVYIHDSPVEVTVEAIHEFSKVLRNTGYLILDNSNWTLQGVDYFLGAASEYFEDTLLPCEFCDPDDTVRGIVHACQGSPLFYGIGNIMGFASTLERAKYLLASIPDDVKRINAQCFAVLRKKY